MRYEEYDLLWPLNDRLRFNLWTWYQTEFMMMSLEIVQPSIELQNASVIILYYA